MKKIENKTFDIERALYHSKNLILNSVSFSGKNDGESFLKESRNIILNNCFFDLRYPFWHDKNIEINNSKFSKNARASVWYSKNIKVNRSKLYGIKIFRDSKDIYVYDSKINSSEFMWYINKGEIKNCNIKSFAYGIFNSKNLVIENVNYIGKYAFQYCNNLKINNLKIKTKDAFWNSKNIIVKDSFLESEYLGWYSENLTLINCIIKGIQPLCYAKKLKIIDCEFIDTNLSFEYSDLEASIKGKIKSIKNPTSGKIIVDEVEELILDNNLYDKKCKIIIKKENEEIN